MTAATQDDIRKLTKAIDDLTNLSRGGRGSSGGSSSRPGGVFGSGGDLPGLDKRVRGLNEQLKDAERGVKKLAKSSSLLAAASIKTTSLLSDTRQLVFFQDMLQKSGEMLKDKMHPNFISLARSMNMLKDGADEFRDGLDSADFAELSLAMASVTDTVASANKEAEKLIKTIEDQVDEVSRAAIGQIRSGGGSALAQAARLKSAGILGLDSPDNTVPGQLAGGLQDILQKYKDQLEAQGITTEELVEGGENLIETFDKLSDETTRVNKVFVDTVKEHTSVLGQLTQSAKVAKAGMHDLATKALGAAAALGSLANIQSKATGLYSELMSFNIAQIPDTFYNLQKRSIALGMSFQDTMTLYRENARLLSVHGRDSFQNVLSGLKSTFNEYGYTMQQGSKMIMPAIENAVLSGVNVRDSDAVSSYMKQTVHNAQLMATVTGKMPEEIIKVKQGVLQSESVFKTMMGMDKSRRAAYAKEIDQTIDRLVLDGMELEQAAEVLKLQQQTARAPLREKMEKATMGMQAARIAGMSPQDAYRLFRLEMQTGYAPGEEAELARLQTLREAGLETGRTRANLATGNRAFTYQNMLDAFAGKRFGEDVGRAGMQAQVRREAGLGLTPQEAAQQAALARGSAAMARFGQTVDYVSSFLKNSLFGTLVGVVAGLGAFALKSMMASIALSKLGLSAAVAGGGGPGGAAGKGGWVGSLVKGAARAGLGMGVGMAGDWLGEKIGGRTGAAISGAATGLGLGLMSKNPYVMLAATLGGAALGAYNYEGGSTGEAAGVNTSTLAAESMQSLSNQTVTVTDKEAQATLQTIAASMNEAVDLLRAMAPAGPGTRRSAFVVPSAAEFVTGNG